MKPQKFKVLTLNVWGIRYLSKDVSLRLDELVKVLLKEDYDIVALQEVWSNHDFEMLKIKLKDKYPNSNYFFSGLIGSGCCIFSRFPILEVLQTRYSLNGAPYKLHHGDWFGGKSIGLAKIRIDDKILHAYVTHLHANYASAPHSDEYLAHRISQAFELSQFIQYTSSACDMVLLMGDLNLEPHELGFKILRDNAGLLDAFVEAQDAQKNDTIGATCYAPSNFYCSENDKRLHPNGMRIDHILYKNSKNIQMNCLTSKPCLGRIPGKEINYSDHEAVFAEFSVSENNGNAIERTISQEGLYSELTTAYGILNKSLNAIFKYEVLFFFIGLMSFSFLFAFNHYDPIFAVFKNAFLTFVCLFCVWITIFDMRIESNNLKSIKHSIELLLCNNQNFKKYGDEFLQKNDLKRVE